MNLVAFLCAKQLNSLVKLNNNPGLIHAVLFAVLVAYVLLGAFVFNYIENKPDWINSELRRGKIECLRDYIDDNWTTTWNKDPEEMAENLVQRCLEDVLTGTGSRWTLLKAFLYSIGIVTTVAKLFCIFYGCIGIPLCIIILANLGKAMSSGYINLKVYYKRYMKRRKRRARNRANPGRVTSRSTRSNQSEYNTTRNSNSEYNKKVQLDLIERKISTGPLSIEKIDTTLTESIEYIDELEPTVVPMGPTEDGEDGEDEDDEDPGEVGSPLVLMAFVIYISVGALFLVLSNPQNSLAHYLFANFLCVTALDFGLLVDERSMLLIPVILIYMCIGIALTTTALDTGSQYLKQLHNVGKKLRNAKFVKIWFGGNQISMQNLMTQVGKQFSIPDEDIKRLNYEDMVNKAIAAAKGKPIPDEPAVTISPSKKEAQQIPDIAHPLEPPRSPSPHSDPPPYHTDQQLPPLQKEPDVTAPEVAEPEPESSMVEEYPIVVEPEPSEVNPEPPMFELELPMVEPRVVKPEPLALEPAPEASNAEIVPETFNDEERTPTVEPQAEVEAVVPPTPDEETKPFIERDISPTPEQTLSVSTSQSSARSGTTEVTHRGKRIGKLQSWDEKKQSIGRLDTDDNPVEQESSPYRLPPGKLARLKAMYDKTKK